MTGTDGWPWVAMDRMGEESPFIELPPDRPIPVELKPVMQVLMVGPGQTWDGEELFWTDG